MHPTLSQHVGWQHHQLKLENAGICGICASSAQLHWWFSLGCILWEGHSLPWPHTAPLGTAGKKFPIFLPYSENRHKNPFFYMKFSKFRKKSQSSLETESRQKDWNLIRQNKIQALQELLYTNQVTLLCSGWWSEALWDKKIDWFWRLGENLTSMNSTFQGHCLGRYVSPRRHVHKKRGGKISVTQGELWDYIVLMCC